VISFYKAIIERKFNIKYDFTCIIYNAVKSLIVL